MNTYTEEEVKRLLDTQRGNCGVAIRNISDTLDIMRAISNAPEPGQWTEFRKKHSLLIQDQYIIDELEGDESVFNKELVIPISKETKEFLERWCNKEITKFGITLYVLNYMKFQILTE